MKHILVEWSKGITQIRSEPETGSEDSLTEQEEIINELYAKLKKLTTHNNLTEEYIRQQFKNHSDCYADTWISDCDNMVEGEVIQAMTEDRFIELIKELNLWKN